MKTKLAEEIKRLRLANGENLKNMADRLGVSSAFLSAVENGKKNMPVGLINKLKDSYELDDAEVERIKQAAFESQKTISINIEKSNLSQRELAVCFARQFEDIDEESNKKIMEILTKRRK